MCKIFAPKECKVSGERVGIELYGGGEASKMAVFCTVVSVRRYTSSLK